MAEHPIIPPPELVAKLWREASAGRDDAPIGEIFNHGVLLAYAAGADQELEACCLELVDGIGRSHAEFPSCLAEDLRAARRPKPPSLKAEALAVIENSLICDHLSPQDEAIIRRALEALPE